jgi:hypothetical protein
MPSSAHAVLSPCVLGPCLPRSLPSLTLVSGQGRHRPKTSSAIISSLHVIISSRQPSSAVFMLSSAVDSHHQQSSCDHRPLPSLDLAFLGPCFSGPMPSSAGAIFGNSVTGPCRRIGPCRVGHCRPLSLVIWRANINIIYAEALFRI